MDTKASSLISMFCNFLDLKSWKTHDYPVILASFIVQYIKAQEQKTLWYWGELRSQGFQLSTKSHYVRWNPFAWSSKSFYFDLERLAWGRSCYFCWGYHLQFEEVIQRKDGILTFSLNKFSHSVQGSFFGLCQIAKSLSGMLQNVAGL